MRSFRQFRMASSYCIGQGKTKNMQTCKRDTKTKRYPSMKFTPERVFSSEHHLTVQFLTQAKYMKHTEFLIIRIMLCYIYVIILTTPLLSSA